MEGSWSYILPEFRQHPFVRFWLKILSDTKKLPLSLYLIFLKIANRYGLIFTSLRKNEKSIKIDKVMPDNMG